MSLQLVILANKSNMYGIAKDVEAVRRAFGGKGYQIRVCDPLEPPSYADMAVHLEVPCHVWMPWCAKNVLVVNPEWYVASAWDSYLPHFDLVVVKDSRTEAEFQAKGCSVAKIPWALPEVTLKEKKRVKAEDSFLWMLGASKSKRAYVPHLLAVWRESYPPLTITTTTHLDLSGVTIPANVTLIERPLENAERISLMAKNRGHVCCSTAEGFGYTAAEAESLGAFTILNDLPVYRQDYSGQLGVASLLPSKLDATGYRDQGADKEDLQKAMDVAVGQFFSYTEKDASTRMNNSVARWKAFVENWSEYISRDKRPKELQYLPPRLDQADCPRISIVTLLYNRRKFFDLACHSLMISDYPKDKIEWILVDDSDDPMEQASDRVMAVAAQSEPLKMVYVPLKKKTPVSEKRNLGVERATSDIILYMDDDDHYPETSLRRRVAWLTGHPWKPKAVACTTIACYDLLKGISAVNVPPTDIPLSQRISEATLTFYKSWWAERPFVAGVQVGEGEGFVAGRESDVLEIPPQQIIVAFSHGKNVSSRRVPSDADVTPGCFWGFPREFLEFIHGLAGVKVVAK